MIRLDNFKTNFVLGLDSLDSSSIFSEPFSKTETAFSSFFPLLVPAQCLDETLYLIFFAVT